MLVKHVVAAWQRCARMVKYAHDSMRFGMDFALPTDDYSRNNQRTGSHCLHNGWFKSFSIVSTFTAPSLSLSLYFRLSMDSSQDATTAIQVVSDA